MQPDETVLQARQLIVQGLSHKEVAQRLGISKRSVTKIWREYTDSFPTTETDNFRELQVRQVSHDLARLDARLANELDNKAASMLFRERTRAQQLLAKLNGTERPLRWRVEVENKPVQTIERVVFLEQKTSDGSTVAGYLPAESIKLLKEAPDGKD